MFTGNQTKKIVLDLGDLVSDVVRLIAKEAVEREVAIDVDVQGSRPKVLGDQVLLQQCVLNLLMKRDRGIRRRQERSEENPDRCCSQEFSSDCIKCERQWRSNRPSSRWPAVRVCRQNKGNGMGLSSLRDRSSSNMEAKSVANRARMAAPRSPSRYPSRRWIRAVHDRAEVQLKLAVNSFLVLRRAHLVHNPCTVVLNCIESAVARAMAGCFSSRISFVST